MSPKVMQYKANSIVFFKGDMTEKVFILKSGRVILKYTDIETQLEMQDIIQTGEFFGVKSALGHYPREETAAVLSDATVLTFSVPEFEAIVMQNTRIIMKMLKVFSNQLRRVHKQLSNLITTGEQKDPENGLFHIGEYYLNCKRYSQAMYAFRRYLTYYPSGEKSQKASDCIEQCERALQRMPGSSSVSAASRMQQGGAASPVMSTVAKTYYNAVSLFSQEKHEEALKQFKKIINEGADHEYQAKSEFEIGRCLFSLGQYNPCISHYTNMIQHYPKHSDIAEALYYVGNSYLKTGEQQRASGSFKKILTMTTSDTPIYRKTKKALAGLE